MSELAVQNELKKLGINEVHWVYETTHNASGIGVMAITEGDRSSLFGPAANCFDAPTRAQSKINTGQFDAVIIKTGKDQYDLLSGVEFDKKFREDPDIECGVQGGIIGRDLLIPFDAYQRLFKNGPQETEQALETVKALAQKRIESKNG